MKEIEEGGEWIKQETFLV